MPFDVPRAKVVVAIGLLLLLLPLLNAGCPDSTYPFSVKVNITNAANYERMNEPLGKIINFTAGQVANCSTDVRFYMNITGGTWAPLPYFTTNETGNATSCLGAYYTLLVNITTISATATATNNTVPAGQSNFQYCFGKATPGQLQTQGTFAAFNDSATIDLFVSWNASGTGASTNINNSVRSNLYSMISCAHNGRPSVLWGKSLNFTDGYNPGCQYDNYTTYDYAAISTEFVGTVDLNTSHDTTLFAIGGGGAFAGAQTNLILNISSGRKLGCYINNGGAYIAAGATDIYSGGSTLFACTYDRAASNTSERLKIYLNATKDGVNAASDANLMAASNPNDLGDLIVSAAHTSFTGTWNVLRVSNRSRSPTDNVTYYSNMWLPFTQPLTWTEGPVGKEPFMYFNYSTACPAGYTALVTYNVKDQLTENPRVANITVVMVTNMSGAYAYVFNNTSTAVICVDSTGASFNGNITATYKDMVSSTRTHTMAITNATSVTVTLYLLSYNPPGLYYTFYVIDQFNMPITNATLSFYYYSVAQLAWIQIESGTTDFAGYTTVLLLPFSPHILVATAPTYISLNVSYTPSLVTSMTIRLRGNNTNVTILPNYETQWNDVSYNVTPTAYFNPGGCNATFQVAGGGNSSIIEYYGMNITRTYNGTTTTVITTNVTTPSNGGLINYTANLTGLYTQTFWFKRVNYTEYMPASRHFVVGNATGMALGGGMVGTLISPFGFFMLAMVVSICAAGYASRYTIHGAGLVGIIVLWGFVFLGGGGTLISFGEGLPFTIWMAAVLITLITLAGMIITYMV